MSGLSLEEYDLLGDSKYRAYVAAVDKTLRNFENTSEWADLISTLGKLNKVLLSHMKYPVVPRRITISKRLAQCMHPALPSGVHLKALETYDIIFKCMGTNRLSQELFIYSAGLFPLFGSAAMNVRSALLTVYETHFVPLGPRLRPGLNGFLSGILTGLEEGSDHLERTSQLLTRVAEGVGQAEFFGCLWDCVWGNSSVRLPAITHIMSCFNKKLSTEDQLYILGTNIDVMVSALCQAMEDSSVLVQRAALDLTLAALPMHNTQLLRPDLVRIVTSAVLVLLRRDMSLNRRLYAWLLGSEINLTLLSSEHPVVKRLNSAVSETNTEDGSDINAYFEAFSRTLLVEGVVACLRTSQGTNPPDLRPYKLLLSLLDKPEIGPFILDDIFLDLLRCLYHTCLVLQSKSASDAPSEPSSRRQSTSDKQSTTVPPQSPDRAVHVSEGNRGFHEVTKTATLLFSVLEPSYPWMHLTGLLSEACHLRGALDRNIDKREESDITEDKSILVEDVGSTVMTVSEVCTLLQHLLSSLPLDTQQQTQASRLPEVLSIVTGLLTDHLTVLTCKELSVGLALCQSILHKLIPSVTLPPAASSHSRPESRASITTFASLQLHALSQVTKATRSLIVPETAARESPPTECGIVQIGIEASEADLKRIEEKEIAEKNNNSKSLVDVEAEAEAEAETSFITNVDNVLEGSDETGQENGGDDDSSKEDVPIDKDPSNDRALTTTLEEAVVDLFEENERFAKTKCEEEALQIEEVPTDSGVDLGDITPQHRKLSRLLFQDPSDEEYESAPQSPSHQSSSPLHNYVKDFERFFLAFIQKRLISSNSSLAEFQNALYRDELLGVDSLSELKFLLKECLHCCKVKADSNESSPARKQQRSSSQSTSSLSAVSLSSLSMASQNKDEKPYFPSILQLNSKANEHLEVFKASCSMLVDLSSLPTTPGMTLNRPSPQIPPWLNGLLACIMSGSQASPQFVLSTISTLLELVMLAQSELSVWQNGSEICFAGEAGVVAVNITPLLLPTHTHILLHHTPIYQHMGRQLWSLLGPTTCALHVTSTELLLQLHHLTLPHGPSKTLTNAAPQSPISIVEREMLTTLTCPVQATSPELKEGVLWSHEGIRTEYDIQAIQQWMTLWQVSRNISSGLTARCPGFDRCLFLMVERLRGDSGHERSLAHSWLATTLQRSDTARLVDPILSLLLHPHTRRVSVQHVNIEKLPSAQQGQGTQSVHEESQIYAISSEGGEVMYHVGKEGRELQSKGKQLLASAKHILALASISKDSKKVVTQHANLTEFELPSSHEQPQVHTPISLMVNPFTQHPWIDMEDLAKMNKPANISNAVRVQNGSYQKHVAGQSDGAKNDLSPTDFEESEVEETEWTSVQLVQSILDDLIESVVNSKYRFPESDRSSELDTMSQSVLSEGAVTELTRHPFHSHMLLYTQVVDCGQCLNGLSLIRNIIEAQPKLSLLTLASTSISTLQSSSPLIVLLARHRRSVFGDGFDGGNVIDMVSQFRSTMYLQVVITVCLYYLRSYYPCLPHLRLRDEHLRDNQEVQVAAAEVLVQVFTHLSPLITDSPRGFTPYITDLLSKCKVQKCVLHCLLSTVHAMTRNGTAFVTDQKRVSGVELRTFTEEVLEYNSGSMNQAGTASREETYLSRVIDLTLALIRLEDTLASDRAEVGMVREPPSISMKYSGFSATKYQPGQPIPAQPMFMEVVTVALKQQHLRHLHGFWLHLITSSLPHMGLSLPNNSLRVTYLVCEMLEGMAHYYLPYAASPSAPPDYVLMLLQSLTTTVHYCLLDPTQSQAFGSSASITMSTTSPTSQTAGQILYNLLHVFSPVGEIVDAPVDNSGLDPAACARQTLLCHLPRIISALLALWVATGEDQDSPFVLGSRRSVRQYIVEFLSPICHHQTPHLLAAISVVWQGVDSGSSVALSTTKTAAVSTHNRQSGAGGLLWSGCPQQLALVEMMSLLRVLPLHTLVATVKQVVKQPPIVDGAKQILPIEVSVLQVFYIYVQQCPGSQLGECWGPLLSMVKEGTLSLSPPAQLVLLATLNEFVQRASPLQDKKDIKELQEVSSKLLESCSNIAGSCLEATTWLRRNLTVKTEPLEKKEGVNDASMYSVAALSVLAELLAPMLDVLYVSEEKDKVVPLLTSIMAHVIPYLRNHTRSNMAAFAACSQLLSSLAGYQYTVRAWRRDVLDLLLDPQAFMMLPPILAYWRTIVDYLCTHDKTVFKELLNRVSMSQGGSLSLFSSKESEYEIRAGLLKRLAFTIFCSETDQYMRHIPDIQERLSEVTRLGQVVPSLVAQVLLCFRVLLLRMSPRGVTSLWPVIITELVQVFLMMEQELATDTEQFSSHLKRLSTLDSSWVFSSQNGLNAHNHPAWLTLYLAACKLLDLMLALPAQHLPQFQMYRWAFVGPIPSTETEEKTEGAGNILLKSCDFVPHVARIAKLMADKPGNSVKKGKTLVHHPGKLLLTVPTISTLLDLQPFFNTLVSPSFSPAAASVGQSVGGSHFLTSPVSGSSSVGKSSSTSNFDLVHIEAVIESDFLEPLQ